MEPVTETRKYFSDTSSVVHPNSKQFEVDVFCTLSNAPPKSSRMSLANSKKDEETKLFELHLAKLGHQNVVICV